MFLDGQAPEVALADVVHAREERAEVGQVGQVPEEAVAGDGIRATRQGEQQGQDADEEVVDGKDAQGAPDVEGLELGEEPEAGPHLVLEVEQDAADQEAR